MTFNKRSLLFASSLFFICLLINVALVFAVPRGADVNPITSSTAVGREPQWNDALAGNVTELTIFGYSTTQSWQGYYGNVSGVIELSNNAGKVMYNWSLASPSGEIYASTNQTLQWVNVQCFNYTATGTYDNEVGNGGKMNLYGTNLSQIESLFGISSIDVDGVDETFNLIGASGHRAFISAANEFSQGECWSTRIFDSTGQQSSGNFENVLLYEPVSGSIVFASLLNKDLEGFDGATHDFEMLVLERGRDGNLDTTRYYFFVELE
ncbi:MAG: hypothetical protein QXJ28_02980 [Candidatus Pacearchaeota archaeon]